MREQNEDRRLLSLIAIRSGMLPSSIAGSEVKISPETLALIERDLTRGVNGNTAPSPIQTNTPGVGL
jgi:hypothetical protein